MFAIVMLTALSMGGASRIAAGNAREHRKQGEPTPHTCESRGRRESQETKTRTVRYQQPASTAQAQRDWTGCNPASRHTHRPDHKRSDLAEMYPAPLPRHAHEPSVWAKTNLETNKRHWHCSNERRSTGTTPRARTQTPNGTTRNRQTNTSTREQGTPHTPTNGHTATSRSTYVDTYNINNRITNDKGLVATQSTRHGGLIHKLNPIKIRKFTRTT